MEVKKSGLSPLIFIICTLTFFCCISAPGQDKNQKLRLAKLVIDSVRLDIYKAALKEEIETSVRVEPGVLPLFAISEKADSTHITILEIYADTNAYKAHLQTSHFIKYKTITRIWSGLSNMSRPSPLYLA